MNFDTVRRRLDDHVRAQGRYQDRQRLLIQFGLECFLRRLAGSPHRDAFVLKGSLLYAIYSPEDQRNTKDADFQLYSPNDPHAVERLFAEVCAVPYDDGVVFHPERIGVEEAGAERGYPGFVVTVPVRYGDDPSTLRFDVGFGEAITPAAEWHDYPSIARFPSAQIRAYPLESFLAEKFEAIVRYGMANTRLKDYYDLAFFAAKVELDSARLSNAVAATFSRRGQKIPPETPIGLTERFFLDKRRDKDWKAFKTRHSLPKSVPLDDCCRRIEGLMMPVTRGLIRGEPLRGKWNGSSWSSIREEGGDGVLASGKEPVTTLEEPDRERTRPALSALRSGFSGPRTPSRAGDPPL